MELMPGERVDDLGRRGYRIIQNPKKFCFGIDAALLSWFARIAPGENAIDLGTGTGIIPWVGVHAIDWVRWFCGGRFKSVCARHTTRFNHGHGDLESAAQMLFELEGDVFASISLDYLRPANAPSHGDDRLRIAGSEGVIEVRDEQCFLIDKAAPGERRMELFPPKKGFFQAFLDAIRGNGEPPVSRAEMIDAARACLLARDSADASVRVEF